MSARTISFLASAAAFATQLFAAEGNMYGNQTQNEGLSVLPRTQSVTIDGDFSDWDLSGQIWSFADWDSRDTFSVRSAAMWDEDGLYLAFDWRDPLPLNSKVNPLENRDKGWQTDAIQLRSLTPDGLGVWITIWGFEGDKPALDVEYCDFDGKRDTSALRKLFYTGKPGEWEIGGGVAIAYRAAADGRGFTQECRIPWSVFQPEAAKPSVTAGDVMKLGLEFYWAAPAGSGWPLHSYKDNLQPGVLTREFFWTAKQAWGDATLLAKGPVEKRTYRRKIIKPEGTIAIRAEIPAGSEFFSVALNDRNGRRVRNIAGGYRTEDFAVGEKDGRTVVEVMWDGTDETGKLVAEGEYTVAALGSGQVDGWWETTFYNPGHPVWETGDGRGAWGADHAPVSRAAAAGTNIVFASAFAEGGFATFAVNPDGRKIWSEKRGSYVLAASSRHVFISPNDWGKTTDQFARLDAATGAYLPFRDGGEMPMRFGDFLGLPAGEKPPRIFALAATETTLAALLGDGTIRLFDAETGAAGRVYRLDELTKAGGPIPTGLSGRPVDFPVPMALDATSLYFVSDRDVCRLDLASGTSAKLALGDTLGAPVALALGPDGSLYVSDNGPDCRIKRFDAAWKLSGTFGRMGGRARAGRFNRDGVREATGIAVDTTGRVWAAENQRSPRRISVWKPDGAFEREFIGNSGYAGEFTFIHADRPDRAFAEMNEIEIEPATGEWKVLGTMYNPDPAKGAAIMPGHTPFHTGDVFCSSASGKEREYFSAAGWDRKSSFLMLMRTGEGVWEPVAGITTVGYLRSALKDAPSAWANRDEKDSVLWNDFNNDGYVQPDECEIPEDGEGRTLTFCALGGIPTDAEDLGFLVSATEPKSRRHTWGRLLPVSFRDGGRPVYSLKGYKPYDNPGFEPSDAATSIPGKDLVVGFFRSGSHAYVAGWRKSTGEVLWRYDSPFHQVHGSHNAPMPRPGLLIGCLKVLGYAKGCGDADVVMIRGNLGEDYFLTTDGLYVNRLTKDNRLPGPLMPSDPDVLKKTSFATLNGRGEPFSGAFARQRDGKIRSSGPIPANQGGNIIRIDGLETIRRAPSGTIAVTTADLAKAESDNLRRALALAKPVEPIKVAKATLSADGSPDFGKAPRAEIRSEGQSVHADFKAFYDAERLYLRWDVFGDDSPWRNTGKDWRLLFKTGDSVDVQLSASSNKGQDPAEGDLRLMVAPFGYDAAVVLMRPRAASATAAEGYIFNSPVQSVRFDSVTRLGAKPSVKLRDRGVTVDLSVTWKELGISAPSSGDEWRGDAGVIASDPAGTVNVARIYRANKHTNLVNDQPGEAMLHPAGWSGVVFE